MKSQFELFNGNENFKKHLSILAIEPLQICGHHALEEYSLLLSSFKNIRCLTFGFVRMYRTTVIDQVSNVNSELIGYEFEKFCRTIPNISSTLRVLSMHSTFRVEIADLY
jgi:hypothetical protein